MISMFARLGRSWRPWFFGSLLLCAMNVLASTSPWQDFDQIFQNEMDAAGVPGGAYAIVQNGKLVRSSGHGVRALGANDTVDDQTVFRIASVSKTFAAEVTALLVSEGKLHWDDNVSRYAPQLKLFSETHLNALQLQHLLSHSTGIVSNAFDNLLDANVPVQKIVPRFRELKPLCKPGQCYTYQNILFSLIAPAVEQAAKLPYDKVLQQRIFTPLQMQHSTVGLEAFLAQNNRAEPHVKRKGEWIKTNVEPGYYEVEPAAGVNTTVRDLATWLLAQMGQYPAVVPPATVEQLTKKRVRTLRDLQRRNWRDLLSDAHYGLGWRIYKVGKEDLYLHSGWVKGYVAEIAYSKTRQTGLVVLLNGETSVISAITTAFWRQQLTTVTANTTVTAAE